MLDFIKYLPFSWRKQDNYCVPQGPSIADAKPVIIPIAGSLLRFNAPRHRPLYPQATPQAQRLPGKDALDQGIRKHYSQGVMANDFWGSAIPFARDWVFWGPWMTGPKAELSMSINIIGRFEEHAYEGISFFHPRVFESVLVDYLNDRYGHHGYSDGTPNYHGPVEWQLNNSLPVFSARCKIYGVGINQPLEDPEELFVFPITAQHFVIIAFRQLIDSTIKGEPAFDITPVNDLQNAIIDSLQLTLSPEAQAEWDKVKAVYPAMQLTKDFAPLQWPVTPNTNSAITKAIEAR